MAGVNQQLFRFLGFQAQGDLGGYTMYTARDGRLVFFPKHPPLKPPSPRQQIQRQRFTMAAEAWQALTPDQRRNWTDAANHVPLSITGYNLFIYHQTTNNDATINTIERLTGQTLLE